MFRRAVILWICLGSLSIYGQQFYFDQFTVSDGLAQSTVYKIIQDRNDIYWVGTQAGVTRFNGVNFINYTAADGLAENGVRAICEDQYGQIDERGEEYLPVHRVQPCISRFSFGGWKETVESPREGEHAGPEEYGDSQ